MNHSDIFDYFERLATEHPLISHEAGKRVSFYVIDDGYDFDELDNALRNLLRTPALLVDEPDGRLSGNESANNTDTMNFNIMIVDSKKGKERVRDVRNRCKQIGLDLVMTTRKKRFTGIVPNKLVTYELESTYSPIGPLLLGYYGYQFTISFTIPITF
ncbi:MULTISPECIES: hypothetical protein [Sphingobacterium]|uniref:Uncharacterized protein n=1 Tax=Sphingobacterium populi TaxID=1812824 RepID=A0ABW5UA05_9SPHI|nr:hypothetical protein [Sphingobacterium sp. CFCC 11742]